MGAALLLGSAAAAHADPGFRLTESAASAGDTVHFAISDAEDVKRYTIEIAGRPVAEGGKARHETITGTFTMPDLGGSARNVVVDARMKEHGETDTASRTLRYIVAAAVEPPPPAAAPVIPAATEPAPAPPPAAPVAPAPPEAPAAYDPPHTLTTAAPSVTRAAPPRRASTGGRTSARHAVIRTRDRKAKRTRSRRTRARTAPLFDGVPEAARAEGGPGGPSSLNSITGSTVAASSSSGIQGGGDAFKAAVIVPALMGFAALLLAGTALARNRRLHAAHRGPG